MEAEGALSAVLRVRRQSPVAGLTALETAMGLQFGRGRPCETEEHGGL
jgi:hypothetical protein